MKKLFITFLFLNYLIVNAQSKTMDFEYDKEITNSEGQRDGELVYTSYDQRVAYKHLYKDGQLLKTTYYRFIIEGSRELAGNYKEEKPFDGYFVFINELEIPLVDYYEKGTLKAQYTCSLLDLITHEGQEFNLKFTKTTYINNKPQDGLIHRDKFEAEGATLLASEYYTDGKITNVDFWLMAMHYAELFKLKFLPNGYQIYKESLPNVQDPVIDNKFRSITVEFENPKKGNILFEVEKELITKYQFNYSDISEKRKPLAGFESYFFLKDNSILVGQYSNIETNQKLSDAIYNANSGLITKVFLMMSNQPIPYFSNSQENDYSFILNPDEQIEASAILHFDEKGNPSNGFLIEKETESNTYKFIEYDNFTVVSEKQSLSLEALKELIKNYKE